MHQWCSMLIRQMVPPALQIGALSVEFIRILHAHTLQQPEQMARYLSKLMPFLSIKILIH